MQIHPTALVDPSAQIGPDCEIGPYVIIGPQVILGARCRVQAHAVLTDRLTLGDDNIIGHGAILGGKPQDFAHQDSVSSEVRIGNRNTFREYVTIHRGTKERTATTLGDDNYLMVGVHVGHNVRIGNRTVMANNVLLAGYVEVFDGAVLGGGSVFHQFMRIGRLAMVRGGTRMSKDIPPFTVADDRHVIGLNSIGLRRSGMPPATRLEIKRAFAHIFRSNLNISQALAAIQPDQWCPEANEFFDYIRESKRGIASWGSTRQTLIDISE